MYPASDSVRQALAADTANQLKELGIQVTIEGVGWDTAYDRAQSYAPLMWAGEHILPIGILQYLSYSPEQFLLTEYSPYSNER